jgi:TonB family protein
MQRGAVTGVQVVKSSGSKTLDAASTEGLRIWRAKPGPPGRVVDIPISFAAGSVKPMKFDGLGFMPSSDVGK